MYVCMYMYMYVCMCVSVCVCVCMFVYMCMYKCVCMHECMKYSGGQLIFIFISFPLPCRQLIDTYLPCDCPLTLYIECS